VPDLPSLILTLEFLEDLTALARADQRRVLRALALLDADERHQSLRVHQLQGKHDGQWSASASDSLRITFERLDGRQKRILGCSHHYGD
jgi:hypothetical protein